MDANMILGLTGLITNVMGTVTSATTQQAQGAAANRAAGIQAQGVTYRAETAATIGEYRAGLTEWAAAQNELYARAKANRVEAEAAAQAEIIARSTSRAMGRATAAYGAAGVSGGSSLWVLNDLATEGTLQANLAIYGGKVAAGDIRRQAAFDTQAAHSQAIIYRTMATAERTAGNIGAAALYAGGQAAQDAANTGAGTTLMTGLGKAASGAANLFASGPSSDAIPAPTPAPASIGGQPQSFYTGGAPAAGPPAPVTY